MNFVIRAGVFLCLLGATHGYAAELYITPWVGYTLGGSVENQDGDDFDLEASTNLGLSVETDLDNGRIGLFYTRQATKVEQVNLDSDVHYLHFQSSIQYELSQDFSSYLGLGLGGSYVDAEWVDDKLGFSASIFGGFEYQITDYLAANVQARWLGTVVDNDTKGVCNLPTTGSDSCVIQFKTSWMNQFSTNVGLTWRF
ncbi:outer membrane beta-barrel protein [Vibrio sinaloensis]|uniref:Outer membrane beta-barrel domain protein n=1 Tax=Photobacterium sp. (strain ATCC 43367) TaxID=379097 RepID=A0A0A5HTE7_PHOS4|nr:outer membrane beta-barrel protein [Vibrio sinaloensis]KGY06801.1 outer membrane beta-barrel domain protein [Vibrio sinaloensis]KHT35879.1 outer membrane beta-barrel domain protein [Vibrio sinaloensis]